MTVFVTFGVNSNIPFQLAEGSSFGALKLAAAPITGGQNIDARMGSQNVNDSQYLHEGDKIELIKATGIKG